jgi:hypothetical protein
MNPINDGLGGQGGKEMDPEETVPEETEGRGMSDEVVNGETRDLPEDREEGAGENLP